MQYPQAKPCLSPWFSLSSFKSTTFWSQEKLLGDIQFRWGERLPKSCPLSGNNVLGLLWLESHSQNQWRLKTLKWPKLFIPSNEQSVAKGGVTMVKVDLTYCFLFFCSCHQFSKRPCYQSHYCCILLCHVFLWIFQIQGCEERENQIDTWGRMRGSNSTQKIMKRSLMMIQTYWKKQSMSGTSLKNRRTFWSYSTLSFVLSM